MAQDRFILAGAVFLLVLVSSMGGVAIAGQSSFYSGKTITLLIGTSPGGAGDLRYRTASKYLQKYLPGLASIVYQYNAGGGGVAAANYMATAAKRDGLTIGGIGAGIFFNAISNAPGVRYNLDDFVFLGAASSSPPYVLVIRPRLQLDTVERLRAHTGLRFAQRSVGHTMYVTDRIFAFVLELKEPRWILGYDNTEVNPAIERGEADARTNALNTLLRDTPRWLKEGYTVPVIMKSSSGKGIESVKEFPERRPTLDQYADTELKQQILRLHSASTPGESFFYIPRGVPDPSLKELKEAFEKIWLDRQFAQEFEALTLQPAEPVPGTRIHETIGQAPSDPKIMEIYKKLLSADPVPPGK